MYIMSIVICANDSSESTIVGQESSIFKANSFRNSLTSTLELPKNSQVAMQSCKITLDGTFGIEGGKKVFYLYLGEYILDGDPDPTTRDNIQETLSTPIRFELFPNDAGTSSYTQEEIAQEIERVLNESIDDVTGQGLGGGCFHPCYAHNGQLPTGSQLCVVERDGTTGEVDGYKIVIQYFSTAADILLGGGAAAAGVMTATGESIGRLTRATGRFGGNGGTAAAVLARQNYNLVAADDGAGNGVVRMVPKAFSAPTFGTTFTGAPVSLFNGFVEYDLTNVTNQVPNGGVDKRTKFCVGLTRFSTTPCPTTAARESRANLGPRDFFEAAGKRVQRLAGIDLTFIKTYVDFGVCIDASGILRVVQCVKGDATVALGGGAGSAENDSPKLQSVDYTRGGTSAAPFNVPYDLHANAGRFTGVKFEVSGQRVKISMMAGAVATVLIEYATGAPRISQNLKPICQTAWNLYPQMMINNRAQDGGAVAVDAFNIQIIKYGTVHPLTDYSAGGCQFLPSYYQTLMERSTAQGLAAYRDLELRWKNIDPATIQYGLADAGTNKFTQYFPVIIPAPSSIYSPSPGANCRLLFGFDGQTGAIDTVPPWAAQGVIAAGTPLQRVEQLIISTSRPDSKSTKSIFVRLDNFQQESMNAANGNPSRIIAHLPRFDGQNETGRLFFEPSTLVYLDLKNPNPLRINQLDLSLVYADESLCDSLTGTTIVVLHFREKP